jgi:hypothetical protein
MNFVRCSALNDGGFDTLRTAAIVGETASFSNSVPALLRLRKSIVTDEVYLRLEEWLVPECRFLPSIHFPSATIRDGPPVFRHRSHPFADLPRGSFSLPRHEISTSGAG